VTVVRISALVVAVAACAWFALGIVQSIDTTRATAIVSSSTPMTAQRAAHARSLLDSAGKLNPDRTVDILRGELASELNQPARAVALLESVTASEPQNADAWVTLARVALHHDTPALERAVARLAELDPRIH
jgi:predicted Zn-dependent protease